LALGYKPKFRWSNEWYYREGIVPDKKGVQDESQSFVSDRVELRVVGRGGRLYADAGAAADGDAHGDGDDHTNGDGNSHANGDRHVHGDSDGNE